MRSTDNLQTASMEPAQLARQIGQGDTAAEQFLVQRYYRPLLEMLRYRTGDPELAQDLLQDTFAIILKRLRGEGLADPGKLTAFMHRTAHNLVVGHFRKDARQRTRPDTSLIESTQATSDGQFEELLHAEESQLVRQLIGELNQDRDREILLRFYVWEQDKLLVCQALGLTAAQFDRVISRARLRLRELLEHSQGVDK